MKLRTTFTAALLLLASGPGLRAQDSAPPKGRAALAPKGGAKRQKTPKGELVDINGATKEELKKLPGITDAYADRIIAGRPYLTKAHLATHQVLPAGIYESLKHRIYASQKAAKP